MKFLELHIDGFGKIHNRTITFGDGINVIYGKNEAGKSTLHTFIRSMLFGLERGRGRAARNDLYSKYEPWENSGSYEGWLRVESEGTVYRIERRFSKSVTVVNESTGLLVEPSRAFWDSLLNGLTETTYNNTISIGQLKSATEESMVGELKNYIANMNNTGSIALNITKASAFLRDQKRTLEKEMSPDASLEYTTLLSEIRNLDAEVSSPQYENQLSTYQTMRTQVRGIIESTQAEKNSLDEMIQKGQAVLNENGFTDRASVDAYLNSCEDQYDKYMEAEQKYAKKSRIVFSTLALVLAAAGAGISAFLGITFANRFLPVCVALAGLAVVLIICGLIGFSRERHWKQVSDELRKGLSERLGKHLGDSTVPYEAMEVFRSRMAEFTRLCDMVSQSEATVKQFMEDINSLQEKQNSCSEMIEQQQRYQWELEKKLERLNVCRTKARELKRVLAENDRIREEIDAIDLAQETMTGLSASIRNSFGLYLNKEASRLVEGITGGIYDSMSIDENLNVFLNTKTKLVPLDQVSSGTMDQVYLALRLAAAKLLQGEKESFPLIFDDSFAQYDDERLQSALNWLAKAYGGQIIIFTCHRREVNLLRAGGIDFQEIRM